MNPDHKLVTAERDGQSVPYAMVLSEVAAQENVTDA